MLVTLTELSSESKRIDLDWTPEELNGLLEDDFNESFIFADRLTGFIEIKPQNNKYYLEGQFDTKVEFTCARCLETEVQEVNIKFNTVLIVSDNNSATDKELSEDELDVIEIVDGKADLKQLVIEQVMLARPMVELCKDDCSGLCPQCGINLNKNQCDCGKNNIDPRLAALTDFKIQTDQ